MSDIKKSDSGVGVVHTSSMVQEAGIRSLRDIWRGMIKRCYNEKAHNYDNYGGRGIGVCDRWRESFDNFAQDMKGRKRLQQIDRINNDGNYSPDNCRWVDVTTNNNNKRKYIFSTRVRYDSIKNLYIAEVKNIDGDKTLVENSTYSELLESINDIFKSLI